MNIAKMKPIVNIYTMTDDKDFAPHQNGKMISLALCMVRIRKRVGDLWFRNNGEIEYWVAGRVGATLCAKRKNYLVYFMKVTDVMTFDLFHRKFPERRDVIYEYKKICCCSSDEACLHRLNPKNYLRRNSSCDKELYTHNTEHDIGKGKYVLISNNYCYYDWRGDQMNVLCLDKWGIPELKWQSNPNSNFREKFHFKETDLIIKKLGNLLKQHSQKYLPIQSEIQNKWKPCKSMNTQCGEL